MNPRCSRDMFIVIFAIRSIDIPNTSRQLKVVIEVVVRHLLAHEICNRFPAPKGEFVGLHSIEPVVYNGHDASAAGAAPEWDIV
jgi:hypothetical protein